MSKRLERSGPAMKGNLGSATVEYTLVTLLLVIVLIASPGVISELIDAIKQLYEAFTSAIGKTYVYPGEPL